MPGGVAPQQEDPQVEVHVFAVHRLLMSLDVVPVSVIGAPSAVPSVAPVFAAPAAPGRSPGRRARSAQRREDEGTAVEYPKGLQTTTGRGREMPGAVPFRRTGRAMTVGVVGPNR